MGMDMENEYQVDIIRSKLTRNLAITFKEVRDELIRTLDASVPVRGDGARQIRSQRDDSLNSVERRLGQSSRCRNDSTCDLRDLESCVCWDSAVCVNSLRSFHSINIIC
jgi:hypothetical protein